MQQLFPNTIAKSLEHEIVQWKLEPYKGRSFIFTVKDTNTATG